MRDNGDDMRRHSSVERLKIFLSLAALCALGMLALGGIRSSARVSTPRAARRQASALSKPTPAPTKPTPAQTKPTPAQAKPTPAPSPVAAEQPKVEGCISCHGQTEPMHKTRDGKLKDDGTDRMSLDR